MESRIGGLMDKQQSTNPIILRFETMIQAVIVPGVGL